MKTFYKKFLGWHPVAQVALSSGPVFIIALSQLGLLPNYPYAQIVHFFLLVISAIAVLIWPYAVNKILLPKLNEDIKKEVIAKTTKLLPKTLLIILLALVQVVLFFIMAKFAQEFKELQLVKFNERVKNQALDFNILKNHAVESFKIVVVMIAFMLLILACSAGQILLYAKFAMRNAIILRSLESGYFMDKKRSRSAFWKFFFIPVGTFLLNKRIGKYLNE